MKLLKLNAILLFLTLLIACNNQTDKTTPNNEVTPKIDTDSLEIEAGLENTQTEYSFMSYFPDLILGKDRSNSRNLIPADIARTFFPYNDPDETATEKLYAIGKIMNYKGLDLFLCDYEHERPDEDTYDNHTDNNHYLLLFKNGQPLKNQENEQLIHSFNSHYYGEGGESDYQCYFDKDTTIITYRHSSESESATGYATPIISTKEFRSKLNEKGEMKITEILRIELSSPFYDQKLLTEKEDYWTKGEEIGFRTHPTKEDKWKLDIESMSYDQSAEIFKTPVDLYFYNEKKNDKMIAVFESCRNGDLIDSYTLGESNPPSLSKDYAGRTSTLKCPVIIKTSDGDLELLPNGKFTLNDKTK